MWIGPHRDTEEGAEGGTSRHREAVRQQRQRPSAHVARVTFDEHEAEFMKGLLEEYPEDDPHFGSGRCGSASPAADPPVSTDLGMADLPGLQKTDQEGPGP